MNNENLKNSIKDVIKLNGNNNITGDIMQEALLAIINQFGSGSVYSGFATPTTNPVNTDVNMFYLAKTPGTYANFGGYVLGDGKIVLFSNKTGSWVADDFISVKSIESVTKTNSVGLVDTYTILYTDSTTSTFTVTNGDSQVSTSFDPNTEIKAQGGKQIADRYDFLRDINKSYVENVIPSIEVIKQIPESQTAYGGKFLQYNNTMLTDTNYPDLGVLYNIDVTDSYQLRVNHMFDIQAGNIPAIVGVKKDNTIVTPLRYTDPGFNGIKNIDLRDIKMISIQVEKNNYPDLKLLMYEKVNLDARIYADERFKTIESFVNPFEFQWTQITMPQPAETDNAAMGINFDPISGQGFAYGLIDKALLDGYDYIRIEGDLNKFSGIWLWGQNNSAGVLDKILSGSNTGSFIFPIDHNKYDNYGYTRYKSGTKIYKGIKISKPIETDSVKKFILENTGSARHKEIDAYIEFGVSPNNTAAQNTIAINKAIELGQALNVPIQLPGGELKHEGIVYYQNTILKGVGMRLTKLISTTAVPALKTPTVAGDPYFGLGVGSIQDMTIEGNHIGTIGIDIRNVANSKYSNVLVKSFTDKCLRAYGLLICEFDNCYFQDAKDGIYLDRSLDSGFGGMHSNLIVFSRCNFLDLRRIGVELTYGAMYTFNSCSIGGTGTDGDDNTGFMLAYNISPLNEGVDITFNECWSEQMKGGFWLNLSNAKGVTTFNDTMVWNFGSAKKGIINNGSRVLLSGSTYVKDFSLKGVETLNGGTTKLQGFASVDTHSESNGGVFIPL